MYTEIDINIYTDDAQKTKEAISTIVSDTKEEFRRRELLRIIREIYSKGSKNTFIGGKKRMRYIQNIEALCK